MSRKQKVFVAALLFVIIAAFIAVAIYRDRRDIFIEVTWTSTGWSGRTSLGYRFIVRNDGTFVSQHSIFLRGYCEDENIGTTSMLLALRRRVSSLSESEMEEITRMVGRILIVYPEMMSRFLLFEEYGYISEECEDVEYIVVGGTSQVRIMHNGIMYNYPIETLHRLGAKLYRLSPLTK